MTAQEFKDTFPVKRDLMAKYGLAYLIVDAIVNINRCEAMLEERGFTVRRVTEHFDRGLLYSVVLMNGVEVGQIDLQGFPSVEFVKGKRHVAALIEDCDLVIAPIPTIHRILDWHTVKGKMH